MAVIAKQRYKLDIAPKGGWVIVYASQHDNGAREIEFEITNQGNAFSIPASINVSVQGIKSNKSYFSHSCSYSGNIVTMALADDMTDIIGKSICVLKFTNSSQQKLATAKFVLNVDTDSSSEGVIIDTEAEEIFNQMLNDIRAQAASISADIAELQSMVGSPLVASTASVMTDHNKIYVYVGSESGYTNGNWYYWNGSAWTSGGVYNSTAFETDKTLSLENMAADAQVTGDEIKRLSTNLRMLDTAYNTPLSGVYWGTIGSGVIAQVRVATSAYSGILFPIPIGTKSIDFSDMTPYSIRLFDHRPILGETVSVGKTAVNKILYLDAQNVYTWGLVTLKLAADGNNKESFVIWMHGTVGSRVSSLEKQNFSVVNGKSIPIVCLIYDDNTDGDDTLHSMLEERGLKGTFSTIGNTDAFDDSWREKAQRLQNWVAEGHGVLGHGLTSGVDVTILDGGSLAGISNISDADARKAIEANNKSLDDYNLPHNGIAYWNVWEDTPHTRNIVEKYYNYGFTFGGANAGINTILTDRFALTRWTTDLHSHMSTALDILKSAIGQKCIVCFGGHMNRTGTGEGTYSTSSEFTSFLNQIKEYVDLGLMVSLSTDDAVRLFYGETNGLKGYYPYLPAVGDMVYDGGIRTCIESGSAYFCRITFAGTPTNGHITIPELDIDVDTYSSDTINNVVNRIVNSVCNKRYTYQRTSSTQLWCYANIARVANNPVVTINTSGLTITFAERNTGKDPVWV